MARSSGGFNANYKSRAMRPGETDVPNPAAGRQATKLGKLGLGSIKGPPSTMGSAPKIKGSTKIGQGVPTFTPPPKRGSRGR